MQEIVRRLLLLALFIPLYTQPITIKHKNSSLLTDKSADNFMNLQMPIVFSNTGLQHFFKQIYSHPRYSQEILAHDFSHLLQFLSYGKKMGQKRAYAKSVLRLFTNKLKSTPFVNGYAFLQMLQSLPPLINDYFVTFRLNDMEPAKVAINNLLLSTFSTKFDELKKDPLTFVNSLSENIVTSLNTRFPIFEDVSAEELRKSLLLFLEIGTSKLVWAPQEEFDTWDLCKKISNEIALMVDTNIIADPDDLNDLYISLIERYCYFLDISNGDLSTDFFIKVQHNVAGDSLLMLDMEESEDSIETKGERLMRALVEGEAKARARELGILV